MKKKIIQLLLLFGLVMISLTACGGNEPANTETPLPLTSTPIPSTESADTETPLPLTSRPIPSTESADSSTDEAGEKMVTAVSYPIVDTDQGWCFSDSEAVECGEAFVGQDAQYEGLQPAYQDNGDGTITDLNTGLMWIQDAGDKTYYADAMEELESYTFAGYDDWRLPTIKELYSLALFSGVDASMANSSDVDGLWPLIDDDYLAFLVVINNMLQPAPAPEHGVKPPIKLNTARAAKAPHACVRQNKPLRAEIPEHLFSPWG